MNEHENNKSDQQHAPFELELERAARAHGFWPGIVEPFERLTLPALSAEDRQKRYAGLANHQRQMLQYMEETNHCHSAVMDFGSQAAAAVFFYSPWKERIKTCSDYVETASFVWTQNETSWFYRREWLRFFNRYREEVKKCWMTKEDLAVLLGLSRPFKLYRGYNKPLGKMGLSWTLHKNVAARIPSVRGRGSNHNPWVITAAANPEGVIAYLSDREEAEIIINPENVQVLKEEPAPEPVPAPQKVHFLPSAAINKDAKNEKE